MEVDIKAFYFTHKDSDCEVEIDVEALTKTGLRIYAKSLKYDFVYIYIPSFAIHVIDVANRKFPITMEKFFQLVDAIKKQRDYYQSI